MTTLQKRQQSTLIQIAETGRLIRELENELGITQKVSAVSIREAVSILIDAPTYWIQSVGERLECAKELALTLQAGNI